MIDASDFRMLVPVGPSGIALPSLGPLDCFHRAMNTEPLFFITRDEGVVAGPYDLVQMAGLLRKKIITSETMTRLDGTDEWKAFSWQPQFIIVKEMPAGAVSERVDQLDQEAELARQGLIPMP